MSTHKFSVPLFTGEVRIVIKKMPKGSYCDAYCKWHEKKDIFEIVLPVKYDAPLAAHECVHATNFIFKSHGQKLDIDNDEAQSYMMSHLMTMVGMAYARHKKKKK